MEDNITLYGASGHGKVVIDILKLAGFRNFTIFDDNPAIGHLAGHPVTRQPSGGSGSGRAIISIGNNRVRRRISRDASHEYISACHPSAIIATDVVVGEGTVIMGGSVVNPGATIGKHCIINTGAVVEHDNHIGDFAHISPAVSLAGNVTVGEGTHVGIGAIVIQGIRIGKWATIGAGAVIIRDVPDYAVVVGNPGKIIKYNEDEQG